jgi:hypothetical protein
MYDLERQHKPGGAEHTREDQAMSKIGTASNSTGTTQE